VLAAPAVESIIPCQNAHGSCVFKSCVTSTLCSKAPMCIQQRDTVESGSHCLLASHCYHGISPALAIRSAVILTHAPHQRVHPHDGSMMCKRMHKHKTNRKGADIAKARIMWAICRGRHHRCTWCARARHDRMHTCGEDICRDERVTARDVVQEVRGRQQSLQLPALRARAAHGWLGVPLCQLRVQASASLCCTSRPALIHC